jgi:hypothetical protein
MAFSMLVLVLLPACAFAGEEGKIILTELQFRGGDFFPVVATDTGPHSTTLTVDGTTKTKGINESTGNIHRLYYKANALEVSPYPGKTGFRDDGDKSIIGDYLTSLPAAYVAGDPNYHIWTFSFYDYANDSTYTDFTLKVRKYIPDVVPTGPLTLFSNVSGKWQIFPSDFAPVSGTSNFYSCLLASGVTYPFTAEIVINKYYKNSGWVDGVAFTSQESANGWKRNVTFTKAKPYIDLRFVPGDVNTEYETYVSATWRLLVAGTDPKSGDTGATFTDGSGAPLVITVAKISDKAYTGSSIKPAVTVKATGKTLKKDVDYTLSYTNNKNVGMAQVIVNGKGAIKGHVTASFKIVPQKVTVKKLTAGSRKLTVRWKKVAQVSKYQVQYKIKGKKTWKTVTVKAGLSTKTIKKLTSGKKYQVKIRAYKTIKTTNYYGAWSKTKTVKLK